MPELPSPDTVNTVKGPRRQEQFRDLFPPLSTAEVKALDNDVQITKINFRGRPVWLNPSGFLIPSAIKYALAVEFLVSNAQASLSIVTGLLNNITGPLSNYMLFMDFTLVVILYYITLPHTNISPATLTGMAVDSLSGLSGFRD